MPIDANHPTPATPLVWFDDLPGASVGLSLHITINHMVLTDVGQPGGVGVIHNPCEVATEGPQLKRWDGIQWVLAPMERHDGSAWMTSPLKLYRKGVWETVETAT